MLFGIAELYEHRYFRAEKKKARTRNFLIVVGNAIKRPVELPVDDGIGPFEHKRLTHHQE